MSCKFSKVLARNFNSRPSARGDDAMRTRSRRQTSFQFTPLREGRPLGSFASILQRFQFTPLREGRLVGRFMFAAPTVISIHAPPRGATMLMRQHIADYEISIHAPPRGATGNNGNLSSYIVHFNSRPSARGDVAFAKCRTRSAYFNSRPSARGDYHLPILWRCLRISIHAPPRGAT